MFEHLGYEEHIYLYKGLKALIEHGDGSGFRQKDRMHSFITAGAVGEVWTEGDEVYGPETSNLWRMLHELSEFIKGNEEESTDWFIDFSNWQTFCQFAIDCDRRIRGMSE